MKIDQEYLQNNLKEISHIIYAICNKDIKFQINLDAYGLVIITCYESFVYKFSLKAGVLYLVREFAKVDVNDSIIFEEELIPIEQYYENFTVIGDLYELIKYLEK